MRSIFGFGERGTFASAATVPIECSANAFRWFREMGLTEIDLMDSDDGWVSVRGRVPLRLA